MSTHSAGGSRQSRAPRRAQISVELGTQHAVGGHTADHGQRRAAGRVERCLGALGELPDDRSLVARRQVGACVRQRVAELAHLAQERGLEPGEREIVPILAAQDEGEREALGVARAGHALELGAAGLAQAEQAGTLVERLAGGVVPRPAEAPRGRVAGHVEHERVPARGEQACERRLQTEGCEAQRRDVTEQVIDRYERQSARIASALPAESPTSSAPISPGPCVTASARDVVERHPGLGERGLDDRNDELEVPPRRDLGHDPTEARMQLVLRRPDARAHLAVARHDGGARVVARGLERRIITRRRPARPRSAGSRHMIRASSRLSV